MTRTRKEHVKIQEAVRKGQPFIGRVDLLPGQGPWLADPCSTRYGVVGRRYYSQFRVLPGVMLVEAFQASVVGELYKKV